MQRFLQIFLLSILLSTNAFSANDIDNPTYTAPADTAQADAFGSMRASLPYTIFDDKHVYGKNEEIWEYVKNGTNAAADYLPYESAVRLTVGTDSGEFVIAQTRRHFVYTPGKSQSVKMTFVFGEGKLNVIKRAGSYNNEDGIFFEQYGNDLRVCIRSSADITVQDTCVSRSNWNQDRLDGSGKSGVNLDITKIQILAFDFQWLGGGRVRIGFVVDGKIYYVHYFNHSNTDTHVYTQNINLPLRYEIKNIGTTASNSSISKICASIASEGGYTLSGYSYATSNEATPRVITTKTPILGLRLKEVFPYNASTWTIRTSAADNQWYSVTYGNGLFVAVANSGTGNRVMTSPDGITWTIRTSAADNLWLGVTYGNGLFVAVSITGTGNRVMTSPDGITWTIRTSAADNSWFSVTYGNGLFVAVSITGTGNRVMTSPDGITWTIRTSAADNDWRGVTYGNGLFVAVAETGTGNRVMTSPDGIAWTTRTSAADNSWFSVTYGNGLFVAVSITGTGNRVMTSPDGIAWTIRTSAADNDWRGVTYGNGLFVAVASTGTGNRVMTSPDGITWTIRTSAADNSWFSVTYGNGLFVAVSTTGTGNRVMTSLGGKANRITVKIVDTTAVATSGTCYVELLHAHDVSATTGTWASVNINSAVEASVDISAVTGSLHEIGVSFASSIGSINSIATTTNDINDHLFLSRDYSNGNSQYFFIYAAPIGASCTISSGVTWLEYY